jgi:hypothetical protein
MIRHYPHTWSIREASGARAGSLAASTAVARWRTTLPDCDGQKSSSASLLPSGRYGRAPPRTNRGGAEILPGRELVVEAELHHVPWPINLSRAATTLPRESRNLHRRDGVDLADQTVLSRIEIALGLQIEPELRRCAELPGQAECGARPYCAPPKSAPEDPGPGQITGGIVLERPVVLRSALRVCQCDLAISVLRLGLDSAVEFNVIRLRQGATDTERPVVLEDDGKSVVFHVSPDDLPALGFHEIDGLPVIVPV